MKYPITLYLLYLLLNLTTYAQVQPSGVFADHMVLQRDMPVPVWGVASVGEKVTVKLNTQVQTAKAGKDGKWMVKLQPMKTGGPYQLEIKGKDAIVYKDIYIGEVWLCSGQSNMDMTVAREDRSWCGVINEEEEVAAANYPLIRLYDVEFNPTDTPQRNVQGKWEICSPSTVGHFSATIKSL
jgi:sialate O-acetylesterase